MEDEFNNYKDSDCDPNSTSSSPQEVLDRTIYPLTFWLGVGLSIASSIFIGASFIIKKVALLQLRKRGTRANEGGYGYLTDGLWWIGLLCLAIGEAANFVAYVFIPASVVSTLGVISVLVAAVLSSQFLNERLNFLGKIGCFLCGIGSTVIVIHSPDQLEVKDIVDLQEKMFHPSFIAYVTVLLVGNLVLIIHFLPKYTKTSTWTLVIWLGVCSMIGSLSVMFCKGFGLAMRNTIQGKDDYTHWLTWGCLVALILSIAVQLDYLNKALDTFSTAIVTPIYYVFFTTCVICASAILFREFSELPAEDWTGLCCGFCIVLAAIFLLQFCKNYDITFANIAQQVVIVKEDEPLDDSNEYKEVGGRECQSSSDSEENPNSERKRQNSRKRTPSQGSYGSIEFI